MRVQRISVAGSEVPSWTVLVDGGFLQPVERFLAHLAATERSPNTIRAYAFDLRDFFQFLTQVHADWAEVSAEDLGRFVGWLREPRPLRGSGITMLPSAPPALTARSVNRKLAAVSAFYLFHQRCGADVGKALAGWDRRFIRGRSFEPFLSHLGTRPGRSSSVTLPVQRLAPQTLSGEQIAALTAGCDRLRDRFLVMLLAGSGLRIGEALGLRHEDIDPAKMTVAVRQRVNANHARAKTWSRSVPIGGRLIQLYSDYLHTEYGDLDSDYVFVNLWGQPFGHPLTYASVYALVRRLRSRTGVDFGPHMFRHTYATDLLRRGTPVEVVRDLLGHASISTTVDTYGHLTVQDSRRALVAAGVFDDDDAGVR